MKRGFKKHSDESAILYRKKLGLTFKDYLPARELAEYLSIALLTPSLIKELPAKHLDLLLNKDKSKWSGAAFKCNERHYILFNDSQADVRIESTIMHEIAHILCNHEPSVPLQINGTSVLLRDHNQEHEEEAEWLGGCLQLPREGLIWALKEGMPPSNIAAHFRASAQMTNYRIGKSGAKIQVDRALKYYKQ